MADDLPRFFARSDRGLVIAAAGCGKTHLIVQAVAESSGRQLVLTHTHAGVKALQDRFQALRVSRQSYRVETIAGWCLRFASSFPILSGLTDTRPTGPAWNQVYEAAARVLTHRTIQTVVTQSYKGCYVDEYQDCSPRQHAVILGLAELLPCRIVGDPLQRVFDFKGDGVVRWATDVHPNFERLSEPLTTPHRWKDRNATLGTWLASIRTALEAGQAVDLSAGPCSWKIATRPAQWKACIEARNKADGRVVGIFKWDRQSHALAGSLKGLYGSMEEMDCRDLRKWAADIEQAKGVDRARAIVGFASKCMTEVTSAISPLLKKITMPGKKPYKGQHQSAHGALCTVSKSEGLDAIPNALTTLASTPGAKLYRRELWHEMHRAMHVAVSENVPLSEAAWRVRERTRRLGRRIESFVISRVLLIKGLEFAHAIVLNADDLTTEELYVALTRGADSLTILGTNPIHQPLSPPAA